MREYKKVSRKDIINVIILGIVLLCIVGGLTQGDYLYGSTTDWENQHFLIPEYLRERFYNTGQLFPNFAFETGGGQNIYYLAYYGLMSPFLYLSYLFPFLEMRIFVTGLNILTVFISTLMIYIWLRKKNTSRVSMITSFLFMMATPIIYHSHRHFMFVNYLPFLIGALMAIRSHYERREKGKSGRLWIVALCSYCIITTSFFFSVGSILAMGIYSLMLYLEKEKKFNIKDCAVYILPVIISVTVGIIMSAILILPTAFTLLDREVDPANVVKLTELLPKLDLDYFVYSVSGMGLTAISIYAMVAAFLGKRKDRKFLAVFLFVIACLPVIIYLMNAGMYVDGKVIIPLLPLVMILVADYIKGVIIKDKSAIKIVVIGTILCVVALVFNQRGATKLAFVVDVITMGICFTLYYYKKWSYVFILPAMLTSFFVSLVVSSSDELISNADTNDTVISNIKESVENVINNDSELHRFSDYYDTTKTVNKVYAIGYYSDTIYSSVSNIRYKDFYYKQITNNNECRNTALMSQPKSVIFSMYMSEKYLISDSAYVPAGYEQISKNGSVYMYESEDVLPIGYGTNSIIKRSEYDKIDFPTKLEVLLKCTVIEDKEFDKISLDLDDAQIYTAQTFESNISKVDLELKVKEDISEISKTDNGYQVDSERILRFTADFPKEKEDKVLFIRFNVDNDFEGREKDVYVTINGIKNKLTEPGWKYHNQNYSFEYVVSSNEGMDGLDFVLSSGLYTIKDIECYEMPYSSISNISEEVVTFTMDKEKTIGDTISGEIQLSNASWLHLSIPYDEGFSIYVDEEKVPYYKSDVDMMGFLVDKGKHNIRIEYVAPLWQEGKIISVIGVILLAILVVFDRKRFNLNYIKKVKE